LNAKLKTDGRVLPQPCPLEAHAADNPDQGRNGCGRDAAVQHGRGEPNGTVKPLASRAEAQCGVSRVFVLDRKGLPLMPCHPARARKLLRNGRARVHRLIPFTIRIVDRDVEDSQLQPVRLKLDPGSKVTGIAIVREDGADQHVLHLAELHHRGQVVRKKMQQRAMYRRRRRSANLRYRQQRFGNRKHRLKIGGKWLPPSIHSCVSNILNWSVNYRGWCPVSGLTAETAKFDTQLMQDPEISGIEYQQGELQGYEIREYLLEKWGRMCAYCAGKDIPLQVEHVVSKAKGGSSRVSNLTLACGPCNQAKGARDVREFLQGRPARLAHLLSKTKRSLRSAAVMNSTRNALLGAFASAGFLVDTATGSRTKYNRERLRVAKTHALDAACCGLVSRVLGWGQRVLTIKAQGRGKYQRTTTTKYGFPRSYSMRKKKVHGFQSGDLVRAVITKGKYVGIHQGSVVVRSRGFFDVKTPEKIGVNWRYCSLLQRSNGYSCSYS